MLDAVGGGNYDDTWYHYWFFSSTRGRMAFDRTFVYGDGAQPPAFELESTPQPQGAAALLSVSDDLPWMEFKWKTDKDRQTQICFAGLGLQMETIDPADPTDYRPIRVAIPDWLILILTTILPALAARRFLRERPQEPGRCRSCGYDLRATPDRCPECGRRSVPCPSITPI